MTHHVFKNSKKRQETAVFLHYNTLMQTQNGRSTAQLQKLIPTLVYIQTHLDGDLSLDNVAQIGELSPFHFHRIFQETTSETLKQYTQRLRLESAAYQLKIRNDSILDIALNNGFQNHETFSRAFKRWFGVSPKQYRLSYGRIPANPAPSKLLNKLTTQYQLSNITIQTLNPLPVAFIRHLGAYTDVEVSRFAELQTWIDMNGFNTGDNLLLGIGHDDPSITPIEKVRYDMCVSVSESFSPDREIGYQTLPSGKFAMASYVGPFGPTLENALGDLFYKLTQRQDIILIGLPLIEIYRTTQINPAYMLNHTDIYIPVQKI